MRMQDHLNIVLVTFYYKFFLSCLRNAIQTAEWILFPMIKFLSSIFLFFSGMLSYTSIAEENISVVKTDSNFTTEGVGQKSAFVIPVKDQIGPPILNILRRGMKQAIESEVDLIIIDMDTPGGELGVTLEIMQEILDSVDSWDGKVLTYVNREAISAGAYIAIATQEIAFAPFSQIGAAEAVSGGGGQIDPSMKRKINSYLKAKIRNFAGPYKYRSLVMAAMMSLVCVCMRVHIALMK